MAHEDDRRGGRHGRQWAVGVSVCLVAWKNIFLLSFIL